MKTKRLLPAVAAALVLGAAATAQQPAPQPPQQDAPSFTNDDISITEPARPREVTGPDDDIDPKTQSGPNLTEEERLDAEATAPTSGAASKDQGPSPAETNWRSRYAAAERAFQGAERQAQEAEIRITELRNQLSTSGTDVRLRQELEDTGNALSQARERVKTARAAFDEVKAEGARKKFKLAPASGARAGAPRDARAQFSEAKRAFDDASRRATLYQNRVSDLNLRITINSGSGDNYAIANLQAELNEARAQLEKARADLQVAQQNLDRARRAAAGAGVPVRDLE
jgi:hypothetical protein